MQESLQPKFSNFDTQISSKPFESNNVIPFPEFKDTGNSIEKFIQTSNYEKLLELKSNLERSAEKGKNKYDSADTTKLENYLKTIELKIQRIEELANIKSVLFDRLNLQKVENFVIDGKPKLVQDEQQKYYFIAHGNTSVDEQTNELCHTIDIAQNSGKPVNTDTYILEQLESGQIPKGIELNLVSCHIGEMPKEQFANLTQTCKQKYNVKLSRVTEEAGKVELGLTERLTNLKASQSHKFKVVFGQNISNLVAA